MMQDSDLPVAPEDVRIIFPGGREVPVECVYIGTEDDAHPLGPKHVWQMVTDVGVIVPPFEVRVRMLPARTTIIF